MRSPTFLTVPNLLNIQQQSSINACIALGMTLVIINGGIDLPVGPVAALTAVLGATMMVAGVPFILGIAGALCVGMFCGFINGALAGFLNPVIIVAVLALVAIAASAIGGASLMGGRGSIVGTLIGCIILGTFAQRPYPSEHSSLLPTACHRYHHRRHVDR